MTNPILSLLFVNYRSTQFLERALQSLSEPLSDIPHEVIVINNDITEQGEVARLAEQYQCILKNLSENRGFGHANNVGAKLAQGKALFFLNPDTSFFSGSFQELLQAFDQYPNAIFGARLLTAEGRSEPWSYGKRPSLGGIFFSKIKAPAVRSLQEGRGRVTTDWVSGAALTLSRETFNKLGGFDEAFFLYYEDVDLCVRAKEQGFPVFTYPHLAFVHSRGMSHTTRRAMKRAYFKSQTLYFQKHGTTSEKILLSILQPLYRFFFF